MSQDKDNNEAASARKDWRKMLTEIGGYENEMIGVPASGVRLMVDEIEELRAQVKAASASQSSTAGASRNKLYTAAINCPHSIDADKIVLYRETGKEGNALSQLGDRLAAACESNQATHASGGASDEVGAFAIRVEKLLCAALGRAWAPSGMSIESLVSDLAHVARQRQESVDYKALKAIFDRLDPHRDAVLWGIASEALGLGKAPERAAVAEGVDTPEFREVLSNALIPTGASMSTDGLASIVAHVSGLCAQQREAGRRERAFYIKDMEDTLSKIGALVGVEQDADALIKAVAALARQPASEGLTKWSYCPECGSEEIHHEEGDHKQCAKCHQEWFADLDYSDVIRRHLAERQSSVAAVPPAKAEGPNDSARYQWMRRTYVSDTEFWPDDVAEAKTGEELDSAIDRAILAQQAKKGGAA